MRTICTLLLSAITWLSLHQDSVAQVRTSASTIHNENSASYLSGFTLHTNEGKVYLEWTVEKNSEANLFEVETSRDGKNFSLAAVVFTSEKKGQEAYKFYEKQKQTTKYYRVKIILKNGVNTYSPVLNTGTAKHKII